MKRNEKTKTILLFWRRGWPGFINEVLRACIFARINVEIKFQFCKPNFKTVVNIYLNACFRYFFLKRVIETRMTQIGRMNTDLLWQSYLTRPGF